jgi:hypothetical protein
MIERQDSWRVSVFKIIPVKTEKKGKGDYNFRQMA